MTDRKKPRLTKLLNFRPEESGFDVCAEDNGQWISILAMDAYIEPIEDACKSCTDLSYDEAERLGDWLIRRAAVGRRNEARLALKLQAGGQNV